MCLINCLAENSIHNVLKTYKYEWFIPVKILLKIFHLKKYFY